MAKSIGTGGGLPYLSEKVSRRMVCQELTCSCQVACGRQLLCDAGVEIAEADLRWTIGYLDGFGTTAASTAQALTGLHPQLDYVGGAVSPEVIYELCQRDPWIASLRTSFGAVHAVIVDKLEQNVLYVRDPWGTSGAGSLHGSEATIGIREFLEHWKWAIHNAVLPIALKAPAAQDTPQ